MNCAPTCAVMAAKWVYKDFSKSVEDARNTYPNNGGGWPISCIYNFLISNKVYCFIGYMPTITEDVVKDNLYNGNILIVSINPKDISYNMNPEQRTGKFYDPNNDPNLSHVIIVKGYRVVDGKRYFEVYDPGSMGSFYADGTPKGKDRYYLSDEIIYSVNSYIVVSSEPSTLGYKLEYHFPSILQNLTAHQTAEDLATDTYVRHVGTPTPVFPSIPLENNRNNTTYYIIDTWNKDMWNRIYDRVMAPSRISEELFLFEELYLFAAWEDLLQVLGLSRLTVYHGPLIYSNYGSTESTIYYDSERELYNMFFAKLDEVNDVFNANKTSNDLQKFDASYNGDISKWLKLINSMRLRLAMRIVKADFVLAKYQAEKAIADPAGLILTNTDNFNISLYGASMPLWTISESFDDTRMGAGMEEFLLGYNDPRLTKWFQPVVATNAHLYANHPDKPYKGIASGSYLNKKDDRVPFSKVSTYFSTVNYRRFLTASEVNFALAEAALRGWAVPKTAKEYYEDGVRASFAEWGASGVDVYLADDTSLPIDYVDPIDSRNSYQTRSTITIKWDELASNEENLERIITQKWIDAFTNANEVWSDHRRTGYPKLHYNPKNDSSPERGVIAADDFLKRMPFVNYEKINNAAGVADATTKLEGQDLISTRLWIHPDKPNF